MDGDDNFITMPGKRLVDGVINHLKHHMVQPGPIGSIPDIHSRAFPDRFQPLQLLDTGFIVEWAVITITSCHNF